jgi:large subunit ribosomal protein L4e
MKLKIYSTDGTEKSNIDMPIQFSESIRKDVIKRAVDAIQANLRQPYGAKEDAGMRHSATLSRRRHDYRGSYGHGISRVPRKIHSRRGTRFNWVATEAPGTVGGRRAHPPKADKIYAKKINLKENRFAIRSALAATLNIELVKQRGHKLSDNYPFVIDESFEKLSKTKDLLMAFQKLGLNAELDRTKQKNVRAGKGKARGRRYNKKVGLLIVTGEKSELTKSISNISGFDVVNVNNLNALILAPGGVPGRMVLWSKSALEKLSNDKLFTEERVKKSNQKSDKKVQKDVRVKKDVKVKKENKVNSVSKNQTKSE